MTGIFNGKGEISEKNSEALRGLINKKYPAKHLKIILVKSLIPEPVTKTDILGVASFKQDWVIVETDSDKQVYAHEMGHSLDLRHTSYKLRAPDLDYPLMYDTSEHQGYWIKQSDWITANIQADNDRYGK